MIFESTSRASSSSFFKEVPSYAIFRNEACLLLLHNEGMLCFIEDGKPSANVRFNKYSLFLCGSASSSCVVSQHIVRATYLSAGWGVKFLYLLLRLCSSLHMSLKRDLQPERMI